MHTVLSARLGQLEDLGWVLRWRAVRRRLNEEADRAATEAVKWAATLDASVGYAADVQWLDGQQTPASGEGDE